MDNYYHEAAIAISEHINGCGWEFDHAIPIYDHEWWDILYEAMYNLLDAHFTKINMVIQLTPPQLMYIQMRATSRQQRIVGLSYRNMVFYDIMGMVEYYGHDWGLHNPPVAYIVPESFYL